MLLILESPISMLKVQSLSHFDPMSDTILILEVICFDLLILYFRGLMLLIYLKDR
jgi:hypothetical protein